MKWICCQLGAREHYAVPRALHRAGALLELVTDAWCPPDEVPTGLAVPARRLAGRYAEDLADANVTAHTLRAIRFELAERLRRRDWDLMMARNAWFEARALESLAAIDAPAGETVLFAYSYAAGALLPYARSRGWHTVLGQIDPGIEEERLVAAEVNRNPDLFPAWRPAPEAYWQAWQAECSNADRVMVNSAWSRSLLERTGVGAERLRVVPLVHEDGGGPHPEAHRDVPAAFSTERPLRVLYLGTLTPRKGLRACVEVAERLRDDRTIEFTFVGGGADAATARLGALPGVHLVGPVPREEVAAYYARADVFLFPTLSDGFGLTQLEARSHRLPCVVSAHCGEVVRDGVDGVVLPRVDGAALHDVLVALRDDPRRLRDYADAIAPRREFTLDGLADTLAAMDFPA